MMNPRKRPLSPLDLPEISDVVSSTECTGLIPARPATQEEADAHLELSSTSLPRHLPKGKT